MRLTRRQQFLDWWHGSGGFRCRFRGHNWDRVWRDGLYRYRGCRNCLTIEKEPA